ncbi:protein GDAP2 homolog [Tetranychus urticae]|uniref:protein GDAP2 homolog n=1 Tax=Tetranychus urticae TaxID=32264 RepID=UPI00077BC178|nr:protein GDAP2 homolog [Tetranychus urticae]
MRLEDSSPAMTEPLSDTFTSGQQRPAITEINDLKIWQDTSPRDTKNDLTVEVGRDFETTPFPYDEKINRKIALWVGDISLLNVEAIVNTTNENFLDDNPVSSRILAEGGPHLRHCLIRELRGCRSGEARLTKGYNLNARYIIHTVGPWYKPKFHTAGENILYSCYNKVLSMVRENKIRTVALPPLNTARRKYPPREAAHIALRVVRRFLEKYGDGIDLIVLVVFNDQSQMTNEVAIYESLMPLYFPRSASEEEQACHLLPKDIGGENGEPLLPERQIRITDKPQKASLDDLEDSVDLHSGLDSSVIVGRSAFAEMHDDIDKPRNNCNSKLRPNDAVSNEIRRSNLYERLLRRSKFEDLSEIASLRCLYTAGEDKFGRLIVVFIGKRFKANQIDLDKALLYLIFTLDRLVSRDFVVMYFHTLTTRDNHPPPNFIRYVYETLDHRYKKNLKAFYIIHPTLWNRLTTWWFTTFTASSIKNKVFCIKGVEFLRNVVSISQLQLPSFIMIYDCKVYGYSFTAHEALP